MAGEATGSGEESLKRAFPTGLLAGLCALSVTADSRADAPVHTDLVERSRVDVVEAWPFVVKAKKPAYEQACRDLGASDLRIVEGGQEVRVLDAGNALAALDSPRQAAARAP